MARQNLALNLRRYWVVVVLAGILGWAAGITYQLSSPATYSSTIRVYVSNKLADNVPVSQTTNLAVQRMQSFVPLVSSTELAERIVSESGTTESAATVSSSLRATFDRDTVLMTVTATAASATDAEQVVRAVPRNMTALVNSLSAPAAGPSSAPTEFTTFDGPTTNKSRSLPTLAISAAFGLVLGLGLGAAIASIVAIRRHGVDTPESLRDLLGRPVVGIIPLAEAKGTHSGSAAGGTSQQAAYGRLALNLRTLHPLDHNHVVVVVTGASSTAGGSATALGLAAALAHSGEDVLLISGDPGSDPDVSGLARSGFPHESSGGRVGIAALVSEHRAKHRVTVVDAPPVLDDLSASEWSVSADIVLLVVNQFGVLHSDIMSASDVLLAAPGAAVGCVLSGVRPGSVAVSRLRSGMATLPTRATEQPAR